MRCSKFCLSTETGKNVDLQYPDPSMIDLEDISTSLSLLVRGNGHSGKLSIAQHSLLTAWYVMNNLEQLPEDQRCSAPLYALLHDAAEAYTSDLPTPFKNYLKHCIDDQFKCVARELLLMNDMVNEKDIDLIINKQLETSTCVFTSIEENIEAAIFAAFSLKEKMSDKTKKLIKQGDKVAMSFEMRDMCSSQRSVLIGCNGYEYPQADDCYTLTVLSPEECKNKFTFFTNKLQQLCKTSVCSIDEIKKNMINDLEKASGLNKQCPTLSKKPKIFSLAIHKHRHQPSFL